MVNHLNPVILAHLIEIIAGTCPATDGSVDQRQAAAFAGLLALEPADFAEAMLASRMIAAHNASMDGFRRAMEPGVGNAEAIRLRANAIAAGRSYDAAQRILDKRRAPAPSERVQQPRQPRATDHPPEQVPLDAFTPEEIAAAEYALDNDPADLARQELAQRIPLHRWEDMTMDERKIAYEPRATMTPAEIAVLGARLAAANRRTPPGEDV